MKNFNIKSFFITNKKKVAVLTVISFLFLFSFIATKAADISTLASNPADWAMTLINGLLSFIISSISSLVAVLVYYLIKIAAYNNFIYSDVVATGWTIVRDVSNMFFIVLFMVVAVSTILRLEFYDYKKMLPKLMIMAVLINFSKMFCGLLIDFSQVITLTFVNAFSKAGGGNFIDALGLTTLLSFAKTYREAGYDINSFNIFTSMLLGLVFVVMALFVVVALLWIFLLRVISFWILIVLSPLAYLAGASGNAGQRYAGKWWDEFTKNLITGPFLAFFLWLSLAVMSGTSTKEKTLFKDFIAQDPNAPSAGITESGIPENFTKFIVSIALLWGSIVAAQEIGSAGAGTAKSIASAGPGLLKGTAMWAGRVADRGLGKATGGLTLNPMTYYKNISEGLKRWGEDVDKGNADKSWQSAKKFGGLPGALYALSTPDFIDEYVKNFSLGKLTTTGGSFERALVAEKKAEDALKEPEEYERIDTNLKNIDVQIGSLDVKIDDLDNGQWRVDADKDALKKADEQSKEMKIKRDVLKQDKIDAQNKKQDLINKGVDKIDIKVLRERRDQARDVAQKKSEYIPGMLRSKLVHDSIVSEKSKSITSENEDELISQWNIAFRNGDKELAEGIMEKITKIGGLNGLLNSRGYTASHSGLVGFIKKEMIKDLGVDEQVAYSLLNNLGETAKGINHWTYSDTTKFKHGKIMPNEPDEHSKVALIEMMKSDPEGFFRKANRLAVGGEDANGEFHFSKEGVLFLKKNLKALSSEIDKGRLNPSMAASISTDRSLAVLREALKGVAGAEKALKDLEVYGRQRQTNYEVELSKLKV